MSPPPTAFRSLYASSSTLTPPIRITPLPNSFNRFYGLSFPTSSSSNLLFSTRKQPLCIKVQALAAETEQPKWWEKKAGPNMIDIASTEQFLNALKDAGVRNRVEALKDLQGEHDELEAKFREERAVLEAKYEKLYQPLYTKRYEIVNGITEVEPTPEDTKMDEGEEKTAEEKGVPSFWLTALKNNDVTSEEVTESDEEALKYLKDIKWCRTEEHKGFKLEFFFDTNPYFKNTVLTKSYHMIDEDDLLLEKPIGTEIDWYPGKCLTQKILKKKPKKGSNAKPITKMEDCESFFNFFNPPQVPEEVEDMDDDSAEELENLMVQDYDIGSAIREKVIPHAVSWFTGEAMEGQEFDLDDDDEDDDIDEDEDEDEDDDDEDEEEDSKTRREATRMQATVVISVRSTA